MEVLYTRWLTTPIPLYTVTGDGWLTYLSATCEEHFSKRFSATRHDLIIHNNRGEIVPLLEYLVRRSTGRYQVSHARYPWYRSRRNKRIHGFGPTVTAVAVTDSVGDTFFRPVGLQGQYHRQQQQALSPSIPPAAIQHSSSYPTDQMFQSEAMDTTDDEEKTTTTISHETRLKIEELKRLVYKYPQYHSNPGGVIACVIHFCNEGDNSILNDKLEQLRMIDSAMGYTRM